ASASYGQPAWLGGQHLGLGRVHRDHERLAEDVGQRAARDAVERRAVDVGAGVLGVLVGDDDRILLLGQREQAGERGLDAAQGPAALEGGAVERAAAANKRQGDAASPL